MTTIQSSKKENRTYVTLEQSKQIINLPPKKVMASKLAAAAAAAAALNNNNTTTVRTTTATIERSEASSTSPSVKRRLSETNENTGVREKKATKSPMMKSASKSITHSERIVLAEISQYKSCNIIFCFHFSLFFFLLIIIYRFRRC